jgi:hypothetical protein
MARISSRIHLPVGVVEGVDQRNPIAVIKKEGVDMATHVLIQVVNAVG